MRNKSCKSHCCVVYRNILSVLTMENIIVKANKHNLYAYYGKENGAQLTNLNTLRFVFCLEILTS